MIKYENDNRQINDWFYAKYDRKKGSAAKWPSSSKVYSICIGGTVKFVYVHIGTLLQKNIFDWIIEINF